MKQFFINIIRSIKRKINIFLFTRSWGRISKEYDKMTSQIGRAILMTEEFGRGWHEVLEEREYTKESK